MSDEAMRLRMLADQDGPLRRDTVARGLVLVIANRLDAAEAEIARLRICLAWERGMIARHEAAAAMGMDPTAASDYRNAAIRAGEELGAAGRATANPAP